MKNGEKKIELNIYLFINIKRHELSLEQKISLIKDNNNGNGLSIRTLANNYSVSKSSVANILTRAEEYQQDYLTNTNKGIKPKLKDNTGKHIDKILVEWFTVQRAKHIQYQVHCYKKRLEKFRVFFVLLKVVFFKFCGKLFSINYDLKCSQNVFF